MAYNPNASGNGHFHAATFNPTLSQLGCSFESSNAETSSYFQHDKSSQLQTQQSPPPPRKSKNRRKRHPPPGPAGVWFQVNLLRSNQSEEPMATSQNPASAASSATDVSSCPAWMCMQLSLNLFTPYLPAYYGPSQRYSVLRKNLPPEYALLRDVRAKDFCFALTGKKLLVLVHSLQCHAHCDWTVELRDECGDSMRAWLSPSLVRQEQEKPSFVKVGAVWCLQDCALLPDRSSLGWLLVHETNLVEMWTAGQTVSDQAYLDWIEKRNNVPRDDPVEVQFSARSTTGPMEAEAAEEDNSEMKTNDDDCCQEQPVDDDEEHEFEFAMDVDAHASAGQPSHAVRLAQFKAERGSQQTAISERTVDIERRHPRLGPTTECTHLFPVDSCVGSSPSSVIDSDSQENFQRDGLASQSSIHELGDENKESKENESNEEAFEVASQQQPPTACEQFQFEHRPRKTPSNGLEAFAAGADCPTTRNVLKSASTQGPQRSPPPKKLKPSLITSMDPFMLELFEEQNKDKEDAQTLADTPLQSSKDTISRQSNASPSPETEAASIVMNQEDIFAGLAMENLFGD